MIQKVVGRRTTQELMPEKVDKIEEVSNQYRLYPYHSLSGGKIYAGFSSLANYICAHQTILIDGYVGVDWEFIQLQLDQHFKLLGLRVNWLKTEDYFKSESEIDSMVKPFLGSSDSVWGKNTTLELLDYFNMASLQNLELDYQADLNVIIGTGASLFESRVKLPNKPISIYVDLPKNELLYRMRNRSIFNLGAKKIEDTATAYKRFYFVDWVVLNTHKKNILSTMSILVDSQWVDNISWMKIEELLEGLKKISHSFFRPRPWFDQGVWGGEWMKEKIPELRDTEGNLAWSFELIAPENGLVFESDGNLLEISFDTLMFAEASAVLGRHFDEFGVYFPIRFDFLDTFNGGNLSIQCHPSRAYIQDNFAEKFTQDETYYILDSGPDAVVYLGFQEDIDPVAFKKELENSVLYEKEIDVEKYIQTFKSEKHTLFLIPNQTVHSSGQNNMVLEISATPYIFTFKMYDWLQKDDAGKARPINIERAFKNLDFERKGARIKQEFISKPTILEDGNDWKLVHLPTHTEHFYDVHRMEFNTQMNVELEQVCHLLMLVEGETIEIETADGSIGVFNYAETVVIPAAASHYTLTNKGISTAKVIKAFVKYDK